MNRYIFAEKALIALSTLPRNAYSSLDHYLLHSFGCAAEVNGIERKSKTQCGYSCLVCINSKATIEEKKRALLSSLEAATQNIANLKIKLLNMK